MCGGRPAVVAQGQGGGVCGGRPGVVEQGQEHAEVLEDRGELEAVPARGTARGGEGEELEVPGGPERAVGGA